MREKNDIQKDRLGYGLFTAEDTAVAVRRSTGLSAADEKMFFSAVTLRLVSFGT